MAKENQGNAAVADRVTDVAGQDRPGNIVEVEIMEGEKKVKRTFKNQAEADQAQGNAANRDGLRFVLIAATGGRQYRKQAVGMKILREVLEDHIADAKDGDGKKLPASRVTASVIEGLFGETTDQEIREIAEYAVALRAAVNTLNGKYQAPLAGGRIPREVAKSCIAAIRSQSTAAGRAQALADIVSALGAPASGDDAQTGSRPE